MFWNYKRESSRTSVVIAQFGILSLAAAALLRMLDSGLRLQDLQGARSIGERNRVKISGTLNLWSTNVHSPFLSGSGTDTYAQPVKCPVFRSNQKIGVFYTKPPKTGSSTLWHYFRSRSLIDNFVHVKENIQHRHRSPDALHLGLQQAVKIVSDAHAKNQTRSFVVSSHSYYVRKSLLPPNTLLLTVVRHPIARKRSEYSYFGPRIRRSDARKSECYCTDDTSFNDCVLKATSDCFSELLGLGYTYVTYFCGFDRICSEQPASREAYTQAVRNIGEYDLIGLTELLDEFIVSLTTRLPFLSFDSWSAPKQAKQSNSKSLSKEAVRKILQYNSQSNELKLYREILERYKFLQSCAFNDALSFEDVDFKDVLL